MLRKEESIYNLVPKEVVKPKKEEIYHSKYPPNIHPTGSTFGLHSTSFPEVCNMNGDFFLPRAAHPMKQMYASFGKPNGTNSHDPKSFIKKGHIYKQSPKPEKLRSSADIRKPKLPSLTDRPIMGLKSDRNYIIANAVDAILSGNAALKQSLRGCRKKMKTFYKKRTMGKSPNT